MTDFWKRKLAAYRHSPPYVCRDIRLRAPFTHEEVIQRDHPLACASR